MNTTIHTDFRQWSEEWYQIRLGRVGGCSSAVLLVAGKNETGLGVGAMSLIYAKAAEIITGESTSDRDVTTPAIERGIELEPIARQRYEEETFAVVQQVGYVSVGEYFGYSPDGLVGSHGMIEIKCPGSGEFLRHLDTRDMKPEYYAQIQWGMFLTGRNWCDFVVYHPDFRPDLIVTRVEADPKVHQVFQEKAPVYARELERVVGKARALQTVRI